MSNGDRYIHVDPIKGEVLNHIQAAYRLNPSGHPRPSPALKYRWACATCVYYRALHPEPGEDFALTSEYADGFCHFNPPVVFAVPDDELDNEDCDLWGREWPWVHEHEFCGKWGPSPDAEPIGDDGT